jgi:hypothetical protein
MTTATMTRELSHAEANAKAWAKSIAAAHEAHQFCAEEGEGRHLSTEAKACLREHGYDGTNHSEVAEWIEEAMQEAPLSVTVRSGWASPEEMEAEEFQILLSTGGPALAIFGDLDRYIEPARPRLMHQDWGTPWTEFFNVDDEALQWFASFFWFGNA